MLRLMLLLSVLSACATTSPARGAHGVSSPLSQSQEKLCAHKVPGDVCVQCHPDLVARFKAAGDWCGEHAIPESQCFACHPELTFTPLTIPDGADYRRVAEAGEDVPSLEAHLAPGKVTVFDFYADWCAPCRTVDAHVIGRMKQRNDIAYRRLNIGGWDTPLAIIGLDLKKLDEAINK
jgi:thiol-disulfide isomerase/thioredoxin